MKNTKIILSVVIFLSIVSFTGAANAAGVSLYISPASATKTAENIFNASIGFNTSGNKVCAVEGTLAFNNLICQGITVASDVMVQSSPTCPNPHFLIGIPNCTTSDKILLTLSVKAGSAGAASISVTGVDIIGEGSSLGSASTSGNYTINTSLISASTPKPAQQVAQPTEQPTQQTQTPVQSATPENNPVINAGTANVALAGSKWFTYLAIILVILVILFGIYYFIKRRKK